MRAHKAILFASQNYLRSMLQSRITLSPERSSKSHMNSQPGRRCMRPAASRVLFSFKLDTRDMKESGLDKVPISGIAKPIFLHLLRFMYGGDPVVVSLPSAFSPFRLRLYFGVVGAIIVLFLRLTVQICQGLDATVLWELYCAFSHMLACSIEVHCAQWVLTSTCWRSSVKPARPLCLRWPSTTSPLCRCATPSGNATVRSDFQESYVAFSCKCAVCELTPSFQRD